MYNDREWKAYLRRLCVRIRRWWWYIIALVCIGIAPLGAGAVYLAFRVESWFTPNPGPSPSAFGFTICATALTLAFIVLVSLVESTPTVAHAIQRRKDGEL